MNTMMRIDVARPGVGAVMVTWKCILCSYRAYTRQDAERHQHYNLYCMWCTVETKGNPLCKACFNAIRHNYPLPH